MTNGMPTPSVTTLGGDPRSVVVRIGETDHVVRPILAVDVQRFLTVGGDAVRALLNGGAETDWGELLATHTDQVIEALAIATRIPQIEVEQLPAVDLIEMAGVTMQLNLDFFVQRARPAIGRLLINLGRIVQHASAPNSTPQRQP